MGFHSLVNTRQFSEAAKDWTTNQGQYTRAPKGSREYREYWDIQEDRCANGFSVGDLWIPGRHYFYLNFTPILKVPDKDVMAHILQSTDKRNRISGTTAKRILEFPRFWEVDYEWYNYKFIAWHGGEFMGVTSPGAQHLCCAKARGAGFSYKEASDGVYNYTFMPNSKSYYFAGLEQYLNKDGIMNKVQGMLDFVNTYCPPWFQNQMKSSSLMHHEASYIDDQGQIKGNKSEIFGLVVNDPDKTRGKRGEKIVFEEAGSFRNLKKALDVCMSSIKDGDFTVGQVSLFGTGGEEGLDIEGLEEIFDKPAIYDMLAFPNIWEEGAADSTCGYFVPTWRVNNAFIDMEGNCEIEGAIQSELQKREAMKGAQDYKKLDRRQAEHPVVPSEVFKRSGLNPFRTQAIKAHLNYVERNPYIQSTIRYGQFSDHAKEGLKFIVQPKAEARPVLQYPHTKQMHTDGLLEGCITIFEEPYRDQLGLVPDNLYFIVFDPYAIEDAEDVTSLFAVYVIKQYNNIDSKSEGLPVANYVGRPEDLDTAYEAIFNLCRYYNGKANGEIAGGGQGVLDYAKTTKQMHLLEYESDALGNKETTGNQKNRSYLMNMPTEKKRMGLTYLVDWHKLPRGVTDMNKMVLNFHRIYDVGLLNEFLKFASGKNADRISAMIIAQFVLKEKSLKAVAKTMESTEDFYNRPLFGADVYESEHELISNY